MQKNRRSESLRADLVLQLRLSLDEMFQKLGFAKQFSEASADI